MRINKNIIKTCVVGVLFMAISSGAFAKEVNKNLTKNPTKNPIVQIKTNKGDVFIELFQDKAPITVKNFLTYVNDDFYDGTIFHRVIKKFVIQGGGFEKNLISKKTRKAIKNEAHNGIANTKGTIVMARTNEIHSATSQFFINLEDNVQLNHRNKSAYGYGYAVFGKVIKGMGIVELIGNSATTVSGVYRDVPIKEVVIKDVTIIRKSKDIKQILKKEVKTDKSATKKIVKDKNEDKK